MGRRSAKYPDELMCALTTLIHEHPGATKEDARALLYPLFKEQYDPERAMEAAFTDFFDGALRRIGREKGCRDILFFRKATETGKTVPAHAVVATVDRLDILEAQLQTRRKQMASLEKEIGHLEDTIAFLRRVGRPVGQLVAGIVIDPLAPSTDVSAGCP